jgi:hypothetical protein
MRITFPKGMIYNAGKKTIVFQHWNEPDASLIIGKTNLEKLTKERLTIFLKEKEFYLIEAEDTFFKNDPSFAISYIDTSWIYNKAIFIIPKNLRIMKIALLYIQDVSI